MPIETPQVFISSTSEFAAERAAIAAAIRALEPPCAPFVYEEESARGASPEEHCRRKLESSEVVVLIVGREYGSEFSARKSIVEWEYDEARKQPATDLQGYIRQVDFAQVDERQRAFIGRLRDFHDGRWCRMFSAADELVTLVVDGVNRWRAECWLRLRQVELRHGSKRDALLLRCGIGLAAGTLAAVCGGVLAHLALEPLLVIAVTGLASIGMLALLARSL